MKFALLLILALGFEFSSAYAGFPCCKDSHEYCGEGSCGARAETKTCSEESVSQCVGKPFRAPCVAPGLNGHTYEGECFAYPEGSLNCFCAN